MTGTKSLQTYKKGDLVKQIKGQVAMISTPSELVRLGNIQIAGESNKHIIAEMLIELNEFSNISRRMTEAQIIETVKMLLSKYPNLSLQEYQVFFNKIKSGYFGQLYESLDGIKIMVFMKEYYREVNTAYIEFKEEKHQEIKRIEGHRDR